MQEEIRPVSQTWEIPCHFNQLHSRPPYLDHCCISELPAPVSTGLLWYPKVPFALWHHKHPQMVVAEWSVVAHGFPLPDGFPVFLQESEDAVKALAKEKDLLEREKWELRRQAKEATDHASALRSQLDLKDNRMKELEAELAMVSLVTQWAGLEGHSSAA